MEVLKILGIIILVIGAVILYSYGEEYYRSKYQYSIWIGGIIETIGVFLFILSVQAENSNKVVLLVLAIMCIFGTIIMNIAKTNVLAGICATLLQMLFSAGIIILLISTARVKKIFRKKEDRKLALGLDIEV